nr:hypothetical protein MarFTME_321 [Marseillevirus futianmevirus]
MGEHSSRTRNLGQPEVLKDSKNVLETCSVLQGLLNNLEKNIKIHR